MTKVLLITPPFTQLNTPYPATAYIKGFLNTKNISAFQMDLGIEVILELFSKNGLQHLFEFANAQAETEQFSENIQRIIALQDDYTQIHLKSRDIFGIQKALNIGSCWIRRIQLGKRGRDKEDFCQILSLIYIQN